jgi:cellulose synthase/poly-beta-1,6-N-acetylglucosamine synthase-like glycosyltransferase
LLVSFVFVVGAVALGIQVIYWFLFWLVLSRPRPSVAARVSVEVPPVSIVVCAHDEEENLRELVPLLLQQDHPEFEVIVVEDRSNDGSYDYLLEATRQHPRLRMVRITHTPEHIHGKKFALTLGIRAARHEWILLTDADCRPASRSWAQSMAASMTSDKKIVIGCSPYMAAPGLLNSFIRFEAWITALQFIAFALLGRPYMGVGRNLAYRKSLFLDAKGFNNYLHVTGGDDDLFVNRHASRDNVAVVITPSSVVFSKPKTSWHGFYLQKIRHLAVGKRYRWADRFLLGCLVATWLLSWLVAVPLLAFTGSWALAGLFFARWVLQITAVSAFTRQVGDAFEWWKVPFLDFIYGFYYLVAGPVALVVQKVRWKKN